MKTIKNYSELGELSVEAKKTIYNLIHNKTCLLDILNLLPKGKSVWIDSFGDGINPNIIAFENRHWKNIFNSSTIKYYGDFYSSALIQSINKYIKPTSIVIYQSMEFRYINEKELLEKMKFLIKSYPTKLLIYINTIHIDFNKLKYSSQHIIKNTKKNINQDMKVQTINNFKYIFEIN